MVASPSTTFSAKDSGGNPVTINTIPIAADGSVPVSAAALPLPAGAATEDTLSKIKAALLTQLDLTDLFVTDGVSFYVRETSLNEGTGTKTTTFLNLDGSAPSTAPVASSLKPVNASGAVVLETTYFDVATPGTGFGATDLVARVLFVNTMTQAILGAAWHNVTQGTVLASAPASGTLVEQTRNTVVTASALPAGAAADGADVTVSASYPAMPTGGQGIRGWLSASFGKLAGILAALQGTLTISRAPIVHSTAITALGGADITPGRRFIADITAAGKLVLKLSSGDLATLNVYAGDRFGDDWAVVNVAAGTTAVFSVLVLS